MISPPSLYDLGLVAALQWLADSLGAQYTMVVHVTDEGSPAVDNEWTRIVLFRAVRELVVNAAIHANVREVWVALTGLDDLVRITVEDRGSGFDTIDRDQTRIGTLRHPGTIEVHRRDHTDRLDTRAWNGGYLDRAGLGTPAPHPGLVSCRVNRSADH